MQFQGLVRGLTIAIAILAALPGSGCGNETGQVLGGAEGADGYGAGPAPLQAGPNQQLWQVPSFEVAPGEEIQNCYAMPPTETELLVTSYRTRQGAGGHHIAIYRALTERPVGQWLDCTAAEDHATLIPVLAATNAPGDGTASAEFPDGMALSIPAGTPLVMQVHYINVTDAPLASDDTALVSLVPPDETTGIVELHTLPLATLDYMLAPGVETAADFDCAVPAPMEIVLLLPHMHSHGRHFELSMGPVDAQRTVIDVPNWDPDMRDRPPLTDFTTGTVNGSLQAGDRIRGTCTWFNETDQVLGFPQEMCASFGYFHSPDPSFDTFTCVD